MSDHEDAQDYTANGPGLFGFRTGGWDVENDQPNVDIGVDVAGTKTGVRGVTFGTTGSSGPFDAGVVGESEVSFGVRGHSTNFAGVFGHSQVSPGVTGQSKSDSGVQGLGAVEVFGEASSDPKDKDDAFSPIGIGVHGLSTEGQGVFGESKVGTGVSGLSQKGRGGTFKSGRDVAQIRLVPQEITNKPPKTGKAGDLMVVLLSLPRAADEPERKAAQLWFCVQGSVVNVQDASWAKVDLSQI